ncbi:MAG TPA: BolA/IbaG family iron-sulfur metabolism protein [Polyangiaceae bacterium]|nr:BolA/IbaG family iron-sulfur metabolism protein [Polyangiaceae bacterium]
MKLPVSAPGASGISGEIRDAIAHTLPGAEVRVSAGSPGHFIISVVAEEFRGKTRLACQRLVYKAIAPLMQGDRAPVHAVDQLETKVP